MRLKNKIQLYTSLSLFLMVLLFHTAIYFIFSMTLTQKDMSRLSEVAENIAIALKIRGRGSSVLGAAEGVPASKWYDPCRDRNGRVKTDCHKGINV